MLGSIIKTGDLTGNQWGYDMVYSYHYQPKIKPSWG
jgi:hypothetical protein